MIAVDLFAGLGGFSLGAEMAGCTVAWAANHWPEAVAIHRLNHPDTQHACQDLQQANWAAVPAMDILLASPACQGHTPARGKERDHHDGMRATAWAVVSAVECHRPPVFVVENVKDFIKWALYEAWAMAMRKLGYSIALHLLDAADHGVAQHRLRMFIVGTRSKKPIVLDIPKRGHIPASRFIDFDAGKWTPIDRPGRSMATLSRIAAGRLSHGTRFIAPYYGGGSGLTGRSLARPIGTITTRDRWAVIDGDRMRMISVNESRQAMGFPVSYHLPHSPKNAMHMLGNAVPPPMACEVIMAVRGAA